MSESMKMYGPFRMSADVYMTDGDRVATVKYTLGMGDFPTVASVRESAAECEKKIKKQMGKKWRLCTKRELFDHITDEAGGGGVQFALPGGDKWDE